MSKPPPATLRSRMLAFAWDYVALLAYLILTVAVGTLANWLAPGFAEAMFSTALRAQAAGFAVITLPIALYFIFGESSSKQATWGKRRAGLRVIDGDGGRVARARASVRTVLKFLPWELSHFLIWQVKFAADPSSPMFIVGFASVWMLVGVNVAWTFTGNAGQMLHDRIAGTFVVRST